MVWLSGVRRLLARRGRGPAVTLATTLAVVALAVAVSPPGRPVADAQPVATATVSGQGPLPGGQPIPPTPNRPVLPRGNAGRAAAAGPGAVLSWGINDHGALGDGTFLSSSTAVSVQGLTGVTTLALASATAHTLAIRRDGVVAAWGLNDFGQLGNNSTTDSNVPVPVTGFPILGDPAVAVAVGRGHSLALLADGEVYAWGDNTYGQLGNPTYPGGTHVSVPVRNKDNTGNLTGIVAIAAGYRHSLAVAGDGTVYAWGYNLYGQLGNNNAPIDRNLPVVVTGSAPGGLANLGNCSAAGANCQVIAGEYHSLARAADGRVFAWGNNAEGELGIGATSPGQSNLPVAVLPPTGTGQLIARSIAAGGYHNLALQADGSVVAWGANYFGQIGDGGTSDPRTRPSPVTLLATGAPVTGIAAVAGGYYHSLAITAGGSVLAWGSNYNGQLGDGTTGNRNRAVPVLNVSGVTAVAAGDAFSFALGPDFPLATVTPQPTATPQKTVTPQPTATPVTIPAPLPTSTPYVYTPPAASAAFYPIAPVRVVDTRPSDPPGILHVGFDETGAPTPAAPLQPLAARRFLVAGRTFSGTTFPATARAIQLNVTALTTTGFGGFLTIYPGHLTDAQRPLTSVLNPILAVNNNFFTTTLAPAGGPDAGTFAAYTQTVPLDLVVDVVGYYQ